MTLIGAQIDSVVLEAVPDDVTFDVGIRLVGHEEEFRSAHVVHVTLIAPDFEELGRQEIPIEAGDSATARIAG